jgi:hypothetical protein
MAYSKQSDLEALVGTLNLAMLTNDTANASTTDATVLGNLIAQADIAIDSKAGQVYQVPLLYAQTGTVSSSSTTVTGTGTKFTQIGSGLGFAVNDIMVGSDGQQFRVTAVASDVSATLDGSPAWSAGTTIQRIPGEISLISRNLTAFMCFARRFSVTEIPKEWITIKANMDAMLDDISNELRNINAIIVSAESNMTTQTDLPVVNFFGDSTDTDNAALGTNFGLY